MAKSSKWDDALAHRSGARPVDGDASAHPSSRNEIYRQSIVAEMS